MVDVKAWVGRNIRAARKTTGLSQFQLAERSELSTDFIGKVERGTTSPSLESLKAIATAMNLSLGDLFAGELRADSPQEALIELIGLCRGRVREDIELLVGIAQLIFQGRRERSRRA
jgi:transcriptional regulator with XRE-family HTH domain